MGVRALLPANQCCREGGPPGPPPPTALWAMLGPWASAGRGSACGGGGASGASASGQCGAVEGSDPPWTEANVWQAHVQACARFPAGLTLLELCGGASTAQCALDLLLGQGKVQCAGYYDSSPECGPVARRVHAGQGNALHIGRTGDILPMPLHAFPSANVLVSGPPCPPWSSMGARGALGDSRASVFMKVVSVVVELANREGQCRPLLCFVLENVEGFMHRIGNEVSAFQAVCGRLQEELHGPWDLRVMHLNSADFGLPQQRRRVYLVGRRGQWFPKMPVRPCLFGPPPSLWQCLERPVRRSGRLAFTRIQAQNLADWKQCFSAAMQDSERRGQCAIVDLSRTPSGRTEWGGLRPREDLCQCLTASGPILHVFALGEGQLGQLSIDRLLVVSERARLQGFPSRLASVDFSEPVGRRVWGNAMSVPVIGSVLATLLEQLLETASEAELLEAFAASLPAPASVARRPVPIGRPCSGSAASAGQQEGRSRSRSPAGPPCLRTPSIRSSPNDVASEDMRAVISAGQRFWDSWDVAGNEPGSASGLEGPPEAQAPQAELSAPMADSAVGHVPGQCPRQATAFGRALRPVPTASLDLATPPQNSEGGAWAGGPVPSEPVSPSLSDEVFGAAY